MQNREQKVIGTKVYVKSRELSDNIEVSKENAVNEEAFLHYQFVACITQ